MRYSQTTVRDALLDLADRAGLIFHFDPGALTHLPPQAGENFSLSMENASIRQALEVIAGQTGLMYFIEPEGVRITHNTVAGYGPTPTTARASDPSSLRSNPVVGQITFPGPNGTTFAFFVREQDLPPEMQQIRQSKLQETLVRIRQQLQAEQQQD